MPLNAVGWTSDEDELLVKLVEPHRCLYNILDPSRKNILARESTWQQIAQVLAKPVEECKKRWRSIRDGYVRSKRMGAMHKTKIAIFEKLQFLDTALESSETALENRDIKSESIMIEDHQFISSEEQVITDNQEYYEITMVDSPSLPNTPNSPLIKIRPKIADGQSIPQKRGRRPGGGRKRALPAPNNTVPIKILPKPILVKGTKLVQYVDEPKPKPQETRSQVIDKLIEKLLKENTNEIDVFFRSMAASVKKLQPNLIPIVKMEVCNVISKYEMQSFDKSKNNY